MRIYKSSLLNLYLKEGALVVIKRLSFLSLLVFNLSQCYEKNSSKESHEGLLFSLAIDVLPGMINHCPASEFVIEKGIDYQLTLQKENGSWFQFSPNGNITPPEESRDYFLTVTKDSSTSIQLKSWTSCKTFSTPPSGGTTPYSETPTEVKYKIYRDSFKFPETNRYRLELNSGNQTIVTIRQN